MGDGQREGGRDRGVDGRAAGGDRIRSNARRDLVLRRDHAFLCADGNGAGADRERERKDEQTAQHREDSWHAADYSGGEGSSVAYTRFSFQVPRRNSQALTTDNTENAMAIAQNTPGGP